MKAPLGALYTVIRWGTGATVATFVDSSDVVVTAMSDGCPIPIASLATVDALLPTRAGSAREAAVATVATRRGKGARSTKPTMNPPPAGDRLTPNSTSRIGTRLRHMGRGQPVDDRLTNGTYVRQGSLRRLGQAGCAVGTDSPKTTGSTRLDGIDGANATDTRAVLPAGCVWSNDHTGCAPLGGAIVTRIRVPAR